MTETPKGRTKLTLKDLKAIEVPEAASLPPRRTTGSLPAIGEPRAPLDPGSYLPDGVSPEVAALLGKPSREQAARAAQEREDAERARIEAEKAAADAARAAADQERLAMEAALAEAQARQAAEEAARARQMKTIVSAFVVLILGLVVAVVVILSRPPLLDPTPYPVALAAVSTPTVREVELGLQAIPEPLPPPEVVEPTRPRSGSSSPPRRPSVRRSDLF